ncbi:MAG: hypothetical protein JO304_03750 [Solirubrobacterales bacterium]|nr:hypothetical protein [Solirubrobacterales bacterium]
MHDASWISQSCWLAAGAHSDLASTLRGGALVTLALLPTHPTARGEDTAELHALGTPATATPTI